MQGSEKQKIFQYAILVLFGAIAIIGVLVLAFFKPSSTNTDPAVVHVTGPTVIWGPPFPGGGVPLLLRQLIDEGQAAYAQTTYVTKNPATMYNELIEAMSRGQGPDALIVDASMLLQLRDFIQPLPYENLPKSDYRHRYVQGAEVFEFPDGIIGLPLVVDPLVLYWNRDLFTNALVAEVPDNWVSFVDVIPRLRVLQEGRELKQSAIAFGEYNNVLHAKEILSALLLQTGVAMVYHDGAKGWTTDMGGRQGAADPVLALKFFADFSNPRLDVYSWNKSFERSMEAFATNKAAMYAGFASERNALHEINPNLNYDIALWPQSTVEGRTKLVYGRFYAIVVLKTRPNVQSAFTVALQLAGAQAAPAWERLTGLPTVRRDMLREVPTDPHSSVMVQSALLARTWLEPGSAATDDIFSEMVNSVTAGEQTPRNALQRGINDLNALLGSYNQ